MFCPRCNTQNELEQKYCRKCGLPLGSIRLALEGHAEEALSKYRKGGGALSAGTIILIVCVLIALLNSFLSSGPRNYGVLINLTIGLLVALPMIVTGLVRVSRAERLLKDKDLAIHLIRGQTDEQALLPPSSHKIDPLAESLSAQNSVTEQATLKLKRGAEHR